MVAIDKLVGDKIRKVLEFEDENGEVQLIEIQNPTVKVKEEFINRMGEEDEYDTLEFLLKELTNVELNRPLKEIDAEEYKNIVFEELIKELSSIVLELVRSFVLNMEVNSDIDEASRLLDEKVDA